MTTQYIKKPKSKGAHYVDNKKLFTEMVKYLNVLNEAKEKTSNKKEWPRVPPYIGEAIFLIASKLSTRPNFIAYSFRDEMISDGVENCLMYLHNFNPDKTNNPFAYFTQIIYYAFIRRIQKEQKQQAIKHKALINSSILNELANMPEGDKALFNTMINPEFIQKSSEMVEKFEKTKVGSRAKQKPKGVEKFIEPDAE